MEISNKQLTLAAILGVVLLLFLAFSTVSMKPATVLPTTTLTAGDATIVAELATTPAQQEQGLSGRLALADGHGMLFVFPSEGNQGIWMKDMRFPIDIVWANQEGVIVTIEHEVSPATYPNSFYPSSPAAYVLELPSGYTAKHGIAIGGQIVVK